MLAAVSWIALGFVKETYNSLLLAAIIVNLFMVMISTVAGAFLVEIGQSRGEVGKMTAIRQLTYNTCSLIQGPLGGYFASMTLLVAAGANAILVISIFPVAYLLVKEKPVAVKNPNAFHNAGNQLKTIGASSSFWLSICFLLLYYFAPGLSTMQYYRQNDVLKLSQQTIGYLGSVGALGAIFASLVYVYVAKRLPLRRSLLFGVVTSAASVLGYLFYNSLHLAYAIDFTNGVFGGFAEIALIDLAARGTPAGCEGLGYSLMMSARNISLFGADWLGSYCADHYHVSWTTMVLLNSGTTFLVLILLPFMPKLIMDSRDNQAPNQENSGEPEAA